MIFIAIALALFVIYAGTRLLIQTKLESHGKFFRFISWFLIVMGFLMVLGAGAIPVMRSCRGGGHGMAETCSHVWRGGSCCGYHDARWSDHPKAKWHKYSNPKMQHARQHRHPCCDGDGATASDDE